MLAPSMFFIWPLAVYLFVAACMHVIATKLGDKDPWLAWIPIANVILLCRLAEKPLWWAILFFLPLVNIIIAIVVWMDIAERRGKPRWLGLLAAIPCFSIFFLPVIAFSD